MFFPEFIIKLSMYIVSAFIIVALLVRLFKINFNVPKPLQITIGVPLGIFIGIVFIEFRAVLSLFIFDALSHYSLWVKIIMLLLLIAFYKFFFQGYIERKKASIIKRKIDN
jgi:hypothetical protein